MERERAAHFVSVSVIVACLLVATVALGIVDPPWTSESASVTVVDENGTRLTTVDVAVADTSAERYRGLSDHESLAWGNGMLFVYDHERSLTYVMRRMDFALDIVFVGADQRVTAVTHAPPPGPNEDGNDIRRSGTGKYVLEVPRGYANETGIEVGDEVRIDLGE